jgi:hypothetical protein
MCEANKRFLLYLLLALAFISVAGALRAEEPGQWYLISETELQSIERYRNSREAERQAWLSQASALRLDSQSLNDQLAAQREVNRSLTVSFNKHEADRLIQLSSKNGEIARLQEEKAETTLEAEKYKGTSKARLFVIIAFAGSWLAYFVFKALRFFKVI